ncbi:MAG: hypothetical protein K8S27_05405 [Candidatus Omnitrophica bacterium]|nr:hypothetical protein [Candidatus Omnitrophota bacterium]
MKRDNLNLGEQPLAQIMTRHNLHSNDIVLNSTEQITHKMISRAVKGRRLTPNVQDKILRALNRTLNTKFALSDLFNYTNSIK